MSIGQALRVGDLVWWPDAQGLTHVGRIVDMNGGELIVQVGPVRKSFRAGEVARWEQRGR